MICFETHPLLHYLKAELDAKEQSLLCSRATPSRTGVRRCLEKMIDHRQEFAVDTDRILHSRAYTRYIDKTQVFYLIENDHITHRVLHVQLVSKIARTIGRFLGLNEDLIEAIALGHDIGHPPFGHDGEFFLSSLCQEHGLPPFLHNVQSVLFLDRLERKGRGWNLTLQTLDGIMCHDGEVHDTELSPDRDRTFLEFDRLLVAKLAAPSLKLVPMTLEGCLVRFADTVSYIGRDIEDAIEVGIIERSEIPAECRELLGETNGTIVYRLVADLIVSSHGRDAVRFSPAISAGLARLKRFNYERIYLNPAIKQDTPAIGECYRRLFEKYMAVIRGDQTDSPLFTEFLGSFPAGYRDEHPPAAVVRDFIAGMTDDYFLGEAAAIGCKVPKRR